ncbi:hypothetical protein TNCV_573031 [Trichonephila clavipes]|nr:hypothetical protein TNCV_573031 [Trichonephila clavipes]
MENNICNSMILTSRRRHFYLVGQSKHKVGACGVNNQASAVLAGNELPFVAFSHPHYSPSNGMVGKAVGISKSIMKKAREDRRDHLVEGRHIRSSHGRNPWIGPVEKKIQLRATKFNKKPDIVTFVELQRLKWVDHLTRMKEYRCCKEIFLAKPLRNRPRGRVLLRWIDCVEKDLSILKVKNWKTVDKSRDAWEKLLKKARTHPGLSSH